MCVNKVSCPLNITNLCYKRYFKPTSTLLVLALKWDGNNNFISIKNSESVGITAVENLRGRTTIQHECPELCPLNPDTNICERELLSSFKRNPHHLLSGNILGKFNLTLWLPEFNDTRPIIWLGDFWLLISYRM